MYMPSTVAGTNNHHNMAEQQQYQTKIQCPNPGDTSALVCKELNALSLQERENVFEDIHGVSKSVDETPAFLEQSFNNFHLELLQINPKQAYDKALRMNSSYVLDKKLRLMFLRAERFDCEKAANNFVTYFEYKEQFFGTELLAETITLSDLMADDKTSLEAGWMQSLPFRDKAGRAVLWRGPDVNRYLKGKSTMRHSWYQFMSMLEDEETQKRGFVVVVYGLNEIDMTSQGLETYWLATKLVQFMPIRIAGCHICIGSSVALPLVSLIMNGSGKDLRARTRIHHGTETEWKYNLLTFGIPVNHAPVTYDGGLKLKHHKQWLERRRVKEVSGVHDDKVELPGRHDVLYSKGAPFQQHIGNIQYHQVVDSYKERYFKAKLGEKKSIVREIFVEVQKQQQHHNLERVRFLERDKFGWWTDVPDELVLKKIAYRLRLDVVTQTASLPPLSSSNTTTTNKSKTNSPTTTTSSSSSSETDLSKEGFNLAHETSRKRQKVDCGGCIQPLR